MQQDIADEIVTTGKEGRSGLTLQYDGMCE